LSRLPADNIFHDSTGDIRKLFESIEREYHDGDGGYIEMMRCHLIEILVMSLRSIYVSPNMKKHSATKKLLEYVDDHYSEHINLGSLCSEMNFSLPYVSMRFREDMGISFQKYLQKVRIDQSCRLLAETNEKITHIANNVGYGDIKFFGKVFREVMNMSPREYRTMMKNNIS
jgi:YesN/AraC family two-component response regulator